MTTDDPLQLHREQAARRPKCCRRLAKQYRELAATYGLHKDRFAEAEATSLEIAGLYEAAALENEVDEDEECEEGERRQR